MSLAQQLEVTLVVRLVEEKEMLLNRQLELLAAVNVKMKKVSCVRTIIELVLVFKSS